MAVTVIPASLTLTDCESCDVALNTFTELERPVIADHGHVLRCHWKMKCGRLRRYAYLIRWVRGIGSLKSRREA